MAKKIKYPYEFNQKVREKAKIYSRGRFFNRIFSGIFLPLVVLSAFLLSGMHLVIKNFALNISDFFLVQIYIIVLLTILNLIEFPVVFYFSYIREHKFGLSNYKMGGWFKDFFKGLFLEYVISLITITALYYILANFSLWWIYAAILYAIFILAFHYIFPIVIFPFFYKVKPYKDEKQKRRLLEMVHSVGAKEIKNVVLALESEKSKKANAMFTGLGNTKQIVLFDTLTKGFHPSETETVVAHELGHYVNKDILRGTFFDAVLAFPAFFLVDLSLKTFSQSFGLNGISDIAGLPLFMLSYLIIEIFLTPLENWYSRKVEAEADWFSLEVAKKPDAQVSTDKRLADMNLSETNPHPLVEWYFYDHPAIKKRIEMGEKWKLKNKRKKSRS
ncbi:TPA: M48 family metallopeptidase [archaeon]|uniref:M48 family metallopeptidase n=1 Tax=Candidatus Naiadarchaeum limnaeum TaxID=2756139 RepID=A0A832V1K9_9ARCH|nr:M48 family metallopeptidase [Candidatus Naiadarchaeales archaeon SRR2090153.bin1042]HIK00423.1 M48 family metallopeptidase [Candidatus Naiadarchaeum limnaeum]